MIETDPERNWPEDFEFENGKYLCHCMLCEKHFLGYKRRLLCKLCSGKLTREAALDVMQKVKPETLPEERKPRGCPCLTVEPCSYACSCAHPMMSGGCYCCATYGSDEQVKKAATRISSLCGPNPKFVKMDRLKLESAVKRLEDSVYMEEEWYQKIIEDFKSVLDWTKS